MPSVTATTATACVCCCPGGKKCFQEWIAVWSCDALSWSGPVSDNRLCLPVDTSTAWTKIAGDDSGCTYRIYVPYTPVHCCSGNTDCSGLGDTATPGLPFGGGTPTDCACPTAAVCDICQKTPRTLTISLDVPGFTGCQTCDNGPEEVMGDLVATFLLTQDPTNPCRWLGSGTGPVVRQYTGPPDDEFNLCSGPFIEHTAFDIIVERTGSLGAGFWHNVLVFGDAGAWFLGTSGVTGDCCASCTVNNDEIGGCHQPGNGGTATITPHCA